MSRQQTKLLNEKKEIAERQAAVDALGKHPEQRPIPNAKPGPSEEDATFIRQSEDSFREMEQGGYFRLDKENRTARFDPAAWALIDVYKKKAIIKRLAYYFKLTQGIQICHIYSLQNDDELGGCSAFSGEYVTR